MQKARATTLEIPICTEEHSEHFQYSNFTVSLTHSFEMLERELKFCRHHLQN